MYFSWPCTTMNLQLASPLYSLCTADPGLKKCSLASTPTRRSLSLAREQRSMYVYCGPGDLDSYAGRCRATITDSRWLGGSSYVSSPVHARHLRTAGRDAERFAPASITTRGRGAGPVSFAITCLSALALSPDSSRYDRRVHGRRTNVALLSFGFQFCLCRADGIGGADHSDPLTPFIMSPDRDRDHDVMALAMCAAAAAQVATSGRGVQR
jgi:hypothetical protein